MGQQFQYGAFDRNTGEVLANFGGGIMVTPHGIHVDDEGNVVDKLDDGLDLHIEIKRNEENA